MGVDHIVTGHNADDIAETVLMNSEFLSLSEALVEHVLVRSSLPLFDRLIRSSLPADEDSYGSAY